jgi:heme O synthase-like polyprenyltransferase
VLLHGIATSLAGLALAAHPKLGWTYGLAALGITSWFLKSGALLMRQPEAEPAAHTFMASNLYLVVILGALMLDLVLA